MDQALMEKFDYAGPNNLLVRQDLCRFCVCGQMMGPRSIAWSLLQRLLNLGELW